MYPIESVIFDLDGVITKTAVVHSAAWKEMFDEYLHYRTDTLGEPFVEFSHETDYIKYVDGKPRYKGVADFLTSRNIVLPYGSPEDAPGFDTVCALGNKKNNKFNEIIKKDGVELYDSTIEFIHQLHKKGVKIAVASSSKNCRPILERMQLIDLFETCVDGTVSAELHLKGKPEPDIFTTAADNMHCSYRNSVVVEDAVSGVQAGRKGNFGLVIGIARENNHRDLEINGADIVVSDISEISLKELEYWFKHGIDEDNWSITYKDYAPEKEKSRETLMTVGNGYFGTRGSMPECSAGKTNYPGTYMAGLYNRLTSKVGDRYIENEDFVNCPNWTTFKFKVDEDDWVNINECKILYVERNLNLANGELFRIICVQDQTGKQHIIENYRMASMHDYHVAAEKYIFSPVNYSGKVTIATGIDGNIINAGVDRYSQLNQQHLKYVNANIEDDVITVQVETVNLHIGVTEAAKIICDKKRSKKCVKHSAAFLEYKFNLVPRQEIEIQKIVSIYNTLNDKNIAAKAVEKVNEYDSYDELIFKSEASWKKIWKEIDIKIDGDRLAQKLIRLHLYHLMVSFSPHNKHFDASITARGLHGEAYRGHIFWDEIFILPFYCMHFPDAAKAMLMYRYRRLDAAKKYAADNGYKGAMFPWQSGSDGREETQTVHLNPVSGEWGPDYSCLQRHVSLAIAYNVYQYFHITGDVQFLIDNGLEMLWEICRFWTSKSEWNETTQRYSISGVMGPDEFHEKYPDSDKGGLKDNAYTNIMTSWVLNIGANLYEDFCKDAAKNVITKINLAADEVAKWRDIALKLNIIVENDIISQYDGYFALKDLDWDSYRAKYGNIYRMDRLLKAEGLSPDDYKVAKQADTLMVFYNLNAIEVTSILKSMKYKLSNNYIDNNLKYYLQRTSHGSTLSRVVHAQLAGIINDKALSWSLYHDALISDYDDTQGGTTAEGIHAGVMSGTILIAMFSFAGIDVTGDAVEMREQKLPEHWNKISGKFKFKGKTYVY
ncbi:MAG: HAD-IA family hydrolase [Bacteroidales bacterium]|nr:HAD-IA family hydrolase [Bacteroidales bacterium]MDD3152826.1 HAD-IA family hydrolase [Bacteroidales bacterium]MDD3913085.1 HAD-IA family hydrolase [Bacteroidales bacterium]MDD4633000.1 HAD-IA family hydrolase [Bacteroidales bacterium]